MSTPQISIIVPVHNVEPYICKCIDSIISQTYNEWECILVDDGSEDRSGAICDEYAQKDNRFSVIHKKNGGVSSARNIGIEKCQGEWCYFVDSDDLLYNNTLEILFNCINDNIDSVCGGYIEIDENDQFIRSSTIKPYKEIIDRDNALIDFYKQQYGELFNGYLWNRLLRMDIIKHNHLRFREDIFIKEDGLFLVQYLCSSKGSHAYTSENVYKYRHNSEGVMLTSGKTFNTKSLSNLYARCECYNTIRQVSDNRLLMTLSMDSIVLYHKMLLRRLINERKVEIVQVAKMTLKTCKYISPFYLLKKYLEMIIKKIK